MPSIPLPGPIPDIPLPGADDLLPGPLNPANWMEAAFGWLNEQVNDLLRAAVTGIEKLIINPPRSEGRGWQDYLYGNALGLAGILAIFTVFVCVVAAAFIPKRTFNLVQALVAAAIVGTLGPIYFALCDQLILFGRDLTEAAQFRNAPTGGSGGGNGLLPIPEINNLLGSIGGLGLIGILGFFLVVVAYLYLLVEIVVKFGGLIALALAPLGEFPKRVLLRLISLGIVAMFGGVAVAVLWLRLGKLASQNLSQGQTGGVVFFLVAGLGMALYSQYWLIKHTHRWVNKVAGRISSNVRGTVETITRTQQSVTASLNAAHANAMRPIPVVMAGGGQSRTERARKEVIRQGALAITPKAAGAASPAAAAAIHLGSKALSRRNGGPT